MISVSVILQHHTGEILMTQRDKPHWQNAFSVIDPQINAKGEHVWPFDLSFPVDVRFFTFAKRRCIPMNHHAYFELLYVHSGEVTCQVQDRCFAMGKGDLAVISSALYHTLRPHVEKHTNQFRAVALYFLPELIRHADAKGDEAEYLAPFLLQDAGFPHVVRAGTGVPAEVANLLKVIHRELPATTGLARLAVKTYLKMILLRLVEHYAAYTATAETLKRKEQAIERLRPLFERLEAGYGEHVSISEAAGIVGMSESHFMRFFKGVTGQSFTTYTNHFRVAKAQELLSSTGKPIAEICQQVGFCDQSYFTLTFRKLAHMTPLQYKRQFIRAPGTTTPGRKPLPNVG